MAAKTHKSDVSTSRLRTARIFRGLSQAELGALVGVSHQFIGYIETGRKTPTPIIIEAISACLGFEPSFFFGPDLAEFRDDECYWRKQSTPSTAKQRALAHGTLFGLVVDYLDSVLRLPPDNVPTIASVSSRDDIERAAERCRMQWGLGIDVPILNVTRAVERAGVVVTRFSGNAATIDAFSRPHRRSIIVMNNDKGSAARSNFDIAHECGHLVLHEGVAPGTPDIESQADQFASAFLMPRAGFVRDFPRPPKSTWNKHYWDSLFSMKSEWRVSVAAIVRRAFDLRLIDAASYHRAYKYMSASGWLRGGEPVPLQVSEPEIVPACMDTLRLHFGMSPVDVASHLSMLPETFSQVTNIPVETASGESGQKCKVIPLGPRLAQRGGVQGQLPLNLADDKSGR
ncbi:ImmA/IrrE family metallo-endopeptidase [Sorangium sp. So ce854]|uniref:ImmA/IrrE family metallo-endopeptidase n=1 Tax=Sorangium sp. So ce854 TaxID=3133322 RepID=UPI003F5E5096